MSKKQQSIQFTVRYWVLFMFLFYTAPDPCEGAICRIHNFCRYSDRWDVCNCTNPWTGTDCANTQYSKIVDPIIKQKINEAYQTLTVEGEVHSYVWFVCLYACFSVDSCHNC